MSTKLTYTGAEVQELLDKIEKGDFDNAKTLEGHPASYFAIASEFTSLAESFATEQGRVDTLCGYFNNGSANDALSLGGQLPSYYATALQYEILQQTLTDFKSLFDSMFEKDSDGNIHAKLSLWSSGGITAGGVGSGGSGGGGGESYNRLDSWSDYSAAKAGYVLSALLGKDLDNRVSALANAGYITQSALAPYALRSEIPSLTGYATESFVTSQGYITASALGGYATQSWVGDNYLSKSGGVITGQGDYAYVQLRLNGDISTIGFQQYGVDKGVVGWLGNTGIRLQNLNGYGLAVRDSNDPIYYWGENGSVQRTLLHSGNYSDLLANGTINGTITAHSFIGNLTGTADNASKLDGKSLSQIIKFEYADNSDGVIDLNNSYSDFTYISSNWPYNGYVNVSNSPWSASAASVWTLPGNYNLQIAKYYKSNDVRIRGRYYGGWTDWVSLVHSGNISSFNAGSATKLQTPRTIWGQSFDGTADITGALTAPSLFSAGISIGCDASGVASDNYAREINTFANKLYLQYRGGDLDLCGGGGTTYIGGALDGKTANFTSLTAPSITANSLTIGGATITYDSVNEALCINGNMYALGGITAGGAGVSAYTSLESRVARLEQQLNVL